MGAAVATAFLGIAGEVSHKMALELRSYGANILLEPAAMEGGGFLREDDLPKIKTVFWKYNITGFAPYLFGVADITANGKRQRGILTGTWFSKQLEVPDEETTVQGIRSIAPWWDVQGGWPAAADEAIVGSALAKRLGITVGREMDVTVKGRNRKFRVAGIVTTGGYERRTDFCPTGDGSRNDAATGENFPCTGERLYCSMDNFGQRRIQGNN